MYLSYPAARRAEYRCERLYAAGVLERKVELTKAAALRWLYRLKTPNLSADQFDTSSCRGW